MRVLRSARRAVSKVSVPTLLLGMLVGAVCAGGGAIAAGKITGAGVKDFSLSHRDIKSNTLKTRNIKSNTLKTRNIKNESLRGKDVRDFSLSNQDVGVLYATVTDEGVVVASSGNVTAARITGGNDGRYQVDFNRNITQCAFVAGVGLSIGGIAEGQAGTGELAGTVDTVRVNTVASNGTPANRPFNLLVVC